ncbi:putative type II thioesterase [Crocosphaera subtropica ATCC 51142]|uniref:Type II thioesterase n=1 Tax=Crocosphaera subtropica (strain ATCC 51142 / BH68) TaxID=43989 RepID=B1WWP7_CROS5|nr:alpha/beta fold hydrolase [Crocosphaera subtropica]ACB50771.1 putative type II thioesterase [Crocosphaera subtropica ATCC 51142]
MKPSTNPWIYLPKPNTNAKIRLFCFPYAGGGTRIFRHWPNHLSDTLEVCAIRLPGREGRLLETPFFQLPNLLESLTPNLLPYLDKPFAFFGHSMGALVCFEVAHQLIKNYGILPLHLFVSGHSAPQLPNLDPPIHQLPESDFIKAIHDLNGTPKEVLKNEELMQLLIPMLRADFSVLETYVYQPKPLLTCPITAFGGLNDPETNETELAAWGQQTNQSFEQHMFPGDHFFIHSAESDIFLILQRSLYS